MSDRIDCEFANNCYALHYKETIDRLTTENEALKQKMEDRLRYLYRITYDEFPKSHTPSFDDFIAHVDMRVISDRELALKFDSKGKYRE